MESAHSASSTVRAIPPVPALTATQLNGSVDSGTIVGTALVPGGIAALVRDSVAGTAAILVVDADGKTTIDLSDPPGALLDQALSVSESTLVVDASVFADGASQTLRWSSDDRHTWSAAR